ncbi:MAG TPA: dTDP-4-dehydrorhamnose 3,5-epimerase [Cytophagales bacterium]|nr:dTDP-4-dehydrorhamnose 3,5-epimerase [Cytophagales bacterium]
MKVTLTAFRDLVIIEPAVFSDDRGYFFETYNQQAFHQAGFDYVFVQDNQSFSTRGVLRGLHFQAPPFAQTKLVHVLSGTIQDVVVDLRKNETTFGKYFSIELSAENHKQLLVPKGFAHGFLVLSDFAQVFYKTDAFYQPGAERGIRYNDPALGINWIGQGEYVVSPRDQLNMVFDQSGYGF